MGGSRPVEAGECLSLEKRDDGVAIVRIDVPNQRLNLLRASFVEELERMLDALESADGVRAVVFASGKPDNFIAGADLRVFENVRFASEGAEISHIGHSSLDRLADFALPLVAAIHGPCLGGGLELALACRARVASSDPKTKLGLPEVKLGLLPGLGGTQRLPRLVGLPAALEMMLSGNEIDALHARRIGLVDEVVAPSILLDVAIQLALDLPRDRRPRKERRRALRGLLGMRDADQVRLGDNLLARKAVLAQARRRLLAKTRGNYPAPERILEVVRVGLDQGLQRGLEAEAKAFGELVTSPQAAQFVNLFFARSALKKDRGIDDPAVEPRELDCVGVVGAGTMGAGIAYVTAASVGLPVRLRDNDAIALGRGLRAIREITDRQVERLQMTPAERERLMARVSATSDYSGFEGADLVIEAVHEDLALKRQIVGEVFEHGRREVIFASNTSSLPIASIAEGSPSPERIIGMHYFFPVHRMPLVEVVVTDQTAPWVIATCVQLGKRQGKTVIVVRDGVGFYASRILSPYLCEAAHLLAEGVTVERIDGALLEWGFPVGPIALLDEIGIDVCQGVSGVMREAFGERLAPPQSLERMSEDRRLGRKSQRGFYVYGKGKKRVDPSVYGLLGVRPTAQLLAGEIVQRCVLRMVNEAAMCFSDGVLRSARDGDVGAIFGLGFPPFRGGPFRYVDEVGAEEIVRRLRAFEKQFGSRFAPARLLSELAEGGGTFYGEQAALRRSG